MQEIESLLKRWQSAGVLDADTAARIRALEAQSSASSGGQSAVQATTPAASPAGLKWLVVTGLILGAILLACGVVLFVSAHWDQLGPGERYLLVIAMVAVFHIAGGLSRSSFESFSVALHAVGTISTGAAIALVGQIFNIQDHWPAAVLLWALAAFAGWALLRDQAQQTLALLLLPAWIFSRTRLSHRRAHRRFRLHGPALLCLGHSLPHFFCRLAAQGGAGSPSRCQRCRRRRRHHGHACRLGLLLLQSDLHPLRHPRLGLDRHRRRAAPHRRISRSQRAWFPLPRQSDS